MPQTRALTTTLQKCILSASGCTSPSPKMTVGWFTALPAYEREYSKHTFDLGGGGGERQIRTAGPLLMRAVESASETEFKRLHWVCVPLTID
jgi:hypothetical protein